MEPPPISPSSPSLSPPRKEGMRQETLSTSQRQEAQISLPIADTSEDAEQSSENMAPRGSQRGGGRSANNQRREADLSSILSVTQKNELVALVASVTNAMQDQICKVFENQGPPAGCRPMVSSTNQVTRVPALVTKAINVIANQAQSQAPHAIEPDGAQGELKREALVAFQKWQAAITKRVSEIHAASDQVQQASQAQMRGPNNRQSARVPGRGLGRGSGLNIGRGPQSDSRSISGAEMAQRGGFQAAPGTSATPITQRSAEKRQHLLHVMILLALSLEAYHAYSRTFIYRIATNLRIPHPVVAEEECRIAWGLAHAANNAFTEEGIPKKGDDGRRDRRGRNAGANAQAGVLGLAHHVDIAEIGSLAGGHGLGSLATATVLGNMGTLSDGGLAVCVFFGMCGPRGSVAKTLDIFTKDVQDVALVPLHGAQKLQVCEGHIIGPTERRLRLTIGINGWLSSGEDASSPWRTLGNKSEAYTLNWEQETLSKIGASISTVASSVAWQNARKDFESRSLFVSLETFKWPNTLLKISKIVDNPWSVGMVRADKVGTALADAIINKVHGERGISLIGYGLGARVIYTCLMSLSERRVFGQVENVLVMGTPAPSSQCVWTALRSVVAGRVVNVFSENDFILGFMHRTGCIQFGVAGLQRIQGVYGIENVDASKPITNHLRYASLVGRILKDIGWEDLDAGEVKKPVEGLRPSSRDSGPHVKAQTTRAAGTPVLPHPATKEGKKKVGRRRADAPVQTASNIR